MATSGDTSRKHSTLLLGIAALRTASDYRAAEIVRRKVGAAQMVAKGPSSPEYASVRLLIGTWDNIAAAARDEDQAFLDFIFEHIPVCHMFEALREALTLIREELGDDYAISFEWLYQKYLEWLRTHQKSEKYRAVVCGGGIHALFG